jgi:hypothetical protein
MDNLEKKIKAIRDQINWAKTEIKRAEYKEDPESLAFFQGILFLEKFLED